jgi:hypothetical protein
VITNWNYTIFVALNRYTTLDGASKISSSDPSRLVTFRSSKSWKRVKQALDEQETVKIYFAPVGGDGSVEYEGTLKALVLKPERGETETDAALGWDLPETKDEGLWENESGVVRTLYLVSNCRKLPQSFPMTELVKTSNGAPISADYGYSYVPVYERGIIQGAGEIYPEEIAEPEKYFEGAVRTVSVNAFERSATARVKCIATYGYLCAICGFDFEQIYGEIGAEFIHVHHLTPIAEVSASYQVDPTKDLRPVCPNCHAMLHRRTPPYTLEELKIIIKMQINNG